jgi:hypothetical protein
MKDKKDKQVFWVKLSALSNKFNTPHLLLALPWLGNANVIPLNSTGQSVQCIECNLAIRCPLRNDQR